MSHEALGKTNKGHATNPNVWFVGVTPRRNPELVVAVLWQNGQFSYYPARIGAKIVSAYVEKQRRLANNLVVPAKPPAPTEMSAVWTVPNPAGAKPGQGAPDRLETGRFLIDHGEIVGQAAANQKASPDLKASANVKARDLKGHDFSRANSEPNQGPALAAEGGRHDGKTKPQGLKPASPFRPASGTAKAVPFQSKGLSPAGEKAVPFQSKDKAPQRPFVPDPQPAIASTGAGDGKGR